MDGRRKSGSEGEITAVVKEIKARQHVSFSGTSGGLTDEAKRAARVFCSHYTLHIKLLHSFIAGLHAHAFQTPQSLESSLDFALEVRSFPPQSKVL